MDDRTQAILNQFADSWTETECTYDDLINKYNWQRLKPVRQFIVDLKQKGGANFFRLGTSIGRLMISRSVNHGLRFDQKYIMIDSQDGKFEVTLVGQFRVYRKYTLDDLSDIRLIKLLKTLQNTIVD